MHIGATAWDEFQWEAHLRRLDRVHDRLMEARFCHPPHPFGTPAPRDWPAPDTPFDDEEFSEDDCGLMTPAGRILRAAGSCTLRAFQLAPPWSGRRRDASLLVEFLANTTAMMALVGRAAGAEEEGEELGKGVALAKRSLAAANRALGALAELRIRYPHRELLGLADELTELRNDIAFYVIDLRERFRACAHPA